SEVVPVEGGGVIGEQHIILVEELILAGNGGALRAGERVGSRVPGCVYANALVVAVHVGQNLRHIHRTVGGQGRRHVRFDQREPGPGVGGTPGSRRFLAVELLNQSGSAEPLHVINGRKRNQVGVPVAKEGVLESRREPFVGRAAADIDRREADYGPNRQQGQRNG